MPGLDTNVLVRWLMVDDVSQTAQAEKLIRSALRKRGALFIPATVQLELEWVLRSRCGLGKADVLLAFNALLEANELELQAESALEQALHLYRQSSAEFADCLHAGSCSAASRAPLMTFDVKAARFDPVELIGA